MLPQREGLTKKNASVVSGNGGGRRAGYVWVWPGRIHKTRRHNSKESHALILFPSPAESLKSGSRTCSVVVLSFRRTLCASRGIKQRDAAGGGGGTGMYPAFCGYAVVQAPLTSPLYGNTLAGDFCRLQLVERARDWRTEHSAITLSPLPPLPCVRWRL